MNDSLSRADSENIENSALKLLSGIWVALISGHTHDELIAGIADHLAAL